MSLTPNERVRIERNKLRLTQDQAVEAIGRINRAYLSAIESDNPEIEITQACADRWIEKMRSFASVGDLQTKQAIQS